LTSAKSSSESFVTSAIVIRAGVERSCTFASVSARAGSSHDAKRRRARPATHRIVVHTVFVYEVAAYFWHPR
jgi:hypothetical protein